MIKKILVGSVLGLLVTACGTTQMSKLHTLALEGHELHASLVTQQIDGIPLHVDRSTLLGNPQVSTEPKFVRTISRGGSQGQLDGEGVEAALYTLYREEKELGFYGLEAGSMADADRLESRLRDIWKVNVSLDRARVHRGGKTLVVVWTDGVSPSCWEAVNVEVAERLSAP